MAPPARLYLVVRADLPPGQQAVQAAHAMREFAAHHPETERAWYESSNTLALLTVEDEAALRALLMQAFPKGLKVSPFHEPDRGGEMTAVAFEPGAKKLMRRLPLALI